MTAPKEYKLSKRSSYYIFTLLFLLYFFDYVDRMIVTSLFPFIQKEWGLTDTQSGMLVSVVYWSIVAFVFPVSILVDRWSRKKTIGIMALPGALVAILFFFVKDYKTVELVKTVDSCDTGQSRVKMSKLDIFRTFLHVPSLILTNPGFIG